MPTIKILVTMFLLSLVSGVYAQPKSIQGKPIEIKVVVVTMFEIGEDQGDKPGEFQLWKEKYALNTHYPFAHHHDIYVNKDKGIMGIVTGMGTAKSASAIMALGLDERFDLSHAYWLVAGIAGVDPQDASIGSAAWASWLVDGDLAHEIDAREMPAEWPSGYFPLFANAPVQAVTNQAKNKTLHQNANGEVYQLNTRLTDWAYQLTREIKLNDYAGMQSLRSKYVGYANAQKPPFVLKGDHLASSTFWHGKLINQWANDWTSFWTQGQGNFVTSGMEDTGSYQSMIYLHSAGKVDKHRFMVLRTASNYVMQPTGLSAAENLSAESGESGFAGMRSALESALMVGGKVVDELVNGWSHYKTALPYEKYEKITTSNEHSKDNQMPQPPQANNRVKQLIQHLALEAHVEGGYFRQTFKNERLIDANIDENGGQRSLMTSIYYLLTTDSSIGHFHKNKSDIMHYFHEGDAITYYLIYPDGTLQTRVLGADVANGEELQFVVPGGVWKASSLSTTGKQGYGLIGEAVAPGFEYQDMQLGKQSELTAQFPQHSDLIGKHTR